MRVNNPLRRNRRSRINYIASKAWAILFLCVVAQMVGTTTRAGTDESGRFKPEPRTRAPSHEVTVQARKRPEPLESLPISVSHFGGADIAGGGASSLADLTSAVPNMTLGGGLGTSLQGEFGLRGLVSTVRTVGVESGLGIYVDDVLVGRPEAFNVDLFDIETIDVLRGPQGTLFGRNTTTGAILIRTAPPTSGTSARLEADVGTYSYGRVTGFANDELIPDKLFARVSGSFAHRAGFYRNLLDNTRLENLNLGSARLGVRAILSEKLETTARFDVTVDRSKPVFFKTAFGTDANQVPGPYDSNRNRQNMLDRDIYGGSLHTIYTFAPGYELHWIAALRRTWYMAALDDDSTSTDQFYSRWSDHVSYVSNELRLSAAPSDRLSTVAGLYYFWQDAKTYRPNLTGADFIFPSAANRNLLQQGRAITNSYAAYLHVSLALSSVFTVSGGARYTYERKYGEYRQDGLGIFPDINFSGHSADHAVTPVAAISAKPFQSVLTYLSVARGFKSGGFNTDFVTTSDLAFGPEHATSIEAGVKFSSPDGKITINGALFHVTYDDLQVAQLVFADVKLTNAGQARSKGVELDVTLRPTDHILFRGDLGYQIGRYTRFVDCLASATGPIDCSGNPLKNAPRWTGSVQISYRVPTRLGGALDLGLDGNFKSRVSFDVADRPELSEGAYALLNAHIGFVGPNWGLTLWAKNITKTLYATSRDERSIFGQFNVYYGAPRTAGLTVYRQF